MKCKRILVIMIIFLLLACGGGSGGGSPQTPDNLPHPTVVLQPLSVTLRDRSDNKINYIDIAKLGSYYYYKLTLTNINPVSITIGTNPDFDSDWLDYNVSPTHIIPTDIEVIKYRHENNPEIFNVVKHFQKTGNNDDCLNNSTLQPNASCSYYMMAVNYGSNNTNQSIFSFPISYYIHQTDDLSNNLTIQQCQYDRDKSIFTCPNLGKAGYSGQFIRYKASPFNGKAPSEIWSPFTGVSNDGKWFYKCDWNAFPFACSKYSLNYDKANNELTLNPYPASTFTFIGVVERYTNSYLRSIKVSPDGKTAWFVMLDPASYDYTLVNSNMPDQDWDGVCAFGGKCVPYIGLTAFDGAVMGLDGSFWWSFSDIKQNADVYDPNINNFIQTNISYVYGVNADGVIIGMDADNQLSCWRKITESQYRSSKVANYKKLPDGVTSIDLANNVYVPMNLDGFIDFSGDPISLQPFYKIHTENGKCEVELDDFTLFPTVTTSQYSYAIAELGTDVNVTDISNSYLGK